MREVGSKARTGSGFQTYAKCIVCRTWDHGSSTRELHGVDGGWTLGPAIDLSDPSILYFTGHRPEVKAGKLDLYRVRYRIQGAAPRS